MNWNYSEKLPVFSMFLPPSPPSPFLLKVFIHRRCKVNPGSARFLCAMNTVLTDHKHAFYGPQARCIAKRGVLSPSIADKQADRPKKVKGVKGVNQIMFRCLFL